MFEVSESVLHDTTYNVRGDERRHFVRKINVHGSFGDDVTRARDKRGRCGCEVAVDVRSLWK